MPDDELSALHDDGNDDNDNDGHDDNDNDHQRLQGHSSDQFSDPGPTSSTPFDPLPSPTPINSRVTTDLSLMPFLLSAVLCCPLCSLPFDSPTTLHCGHTICSAHLADSCPVPSCSPQNNPTNPIIPSYSTVSFFPAESPPPTLPPPTYSSHVDVTISKVISLVSRVEAEQDAYPTVDHIDGNLSDDNDNDNTPPRPSRIRPRPNSTPSPPRIRKRRRYSPKPDHDDHDLLAHLRKQSTVQRSTPHDEPLLPSHPPSARNDILSHFQKDLLAELTCDICCTLFFQPVTTPCQHTFCSKCLHRALDHSSACPICRQNLPGFSYFQDHPENKVILSLILKAFPANYKERGDAIEAEEREARLDTPIFVCQLSYPGMPTVLHFFEPRYRLMLRRCLESPSPRFGMVMAPKPGGSSPHEYGTMLEIRRVQMLPDGRSVVETWGSFRFRLLESGMMDGYMVGRIERIDDYPEDIIETVHTGGDREPPLVPSPEITPPLASSSSSATSSPHSPTTPPSLPRQLTNAELMEQCRTFLDRLQRGTAPWVVQRLRITYGTIPTDPSSFSFWVAWIIPIEEQEKAKLLPIRSPRLRLLLVAHWIEQLDNNWYKERILINCIVLLMALSVSFFALRAVLAGA